MIICGIITERDYLRQIALEGRTSKATQVREIMTQRLIAVTPGHALQLSVLANDGRALEAATSPMQPGAGFDLPLVPDGWLLLSDLVRKERGVFEVREDTRIPLREWTEQPIIFPRGGASVQVHFTGPAAQRGPSFPALSPGARAELGWPETGDR